VCLGKARQGAGLKNAGGGLREERQLLRMPAQSAIWRMCRLNISWPDNLMEATVNKKLF
jgi:hypothetical protein